MSIKIKKSRLNLCFGDFRKESDPETNETSDGETLSFFFPFHFHGVCLLLLLFSVAFARFKSPFAD